MNAPWLRGVRLYYILHLRGPGFESKGNFLDPTFWPFFANFQLISKHTHKYSAKLLSNLAIFRSFCNSYYLGSKIKGLK